VVNTQDDPSRLDVGVDAADFVATSQQNSRGVRRASGSVQIAKS
jgi:hypothetical protein